MVPQTYPSVYNTYTNRTEMVVYELTSIIGMVRWTDYIPVKMTTSTNAAKDNTTDNDGCIAISPLGSITNKQAFTDYIPIYVDNSATDAWAVSATGYIPYGISSAAIGILKRFGSDAHVYLPGIGTLSGLQAANYLDSAGTTLATVDSPVGLVLDAMGSVGVPLATLGTYIGYNTSAVTNGGVLPSQATAIGAGNYGLRVSGALTIGVTYKATLSWSGNSLGRNISLDGSLGAVLSNAAAGTATYFFKAGVSEHYIYLINATSAGETFTALSCTMEPVTGIHATQPTTAAKPRLERGVRNLLTWSSDFSNAAWIKAGAPTLTPGQTGQLGGATATRVQSGSSVYTMTEQLATAATSLTYTVAAWVKATSSNSTFRLCLTSASVADYFSADFTATSQWQLFVFTKVFGGGDTGFVKAGIAFKDSASNTFDVLVDGSALFQGTLTAAQILAEGGIPLTTTAAASNPSAGKYSWAFDGGDSLSLGSVPFQMSDDHAVIAGGFIGSAAATPKAVFANGSAGASDSLPWLGFNGSGKISYYVSGGGTTLGGVGIAPVEQVNTPVVLSGRKTGSAISTRRNGVEQVLQTASGTYSTATTTAIGSNSRPTPGEYLTGSTGPVLAIKGTLTDSELLTLERLVANLTPNAPVF